MVLPVQAKAIRGWLSVGRFLSDSTNFWITVAGPSIGGQQEAWQVVCRFYGGYLLRERLYINAKHYWLGDCNRAVTIKRPTLEVFICHGRSNTRPAIGTISFHGYVGGRMTLEQARAVSVPMLAQKIETNLLTRFKLRGLCSIGESSCLVLVTGLSSDLCHVQMAATIELPELTY